MDIKSITTTSGKIKHLRERRPLNHGIEIEGENNWLTFIQNVREEKKIKYFFEF